MHDFTFASLFGGIGGARRGMERAGGTCIYTNEWDKFARQTYEANYGEAPDPRDIALVTPEDIPDCDAFVGGFPCQPFSKAGVSKKNSLGKPTGFLDETQGTCFFHMARLIKAKQPRFFVAENVRGLLSHGGGRTFEVILNTIVHDLKYDVTWRVVDACSWVPQHRKRVFIVGTRAVDFDLDDMSVPDPAAGPKLGVILEPEVDDKYTLSDTLMEALEAHRQKSRDGGRGFGYSVVGPDDVTRTLSARYYKDGAEILVGQDGKNPRRLAPRECARLMGFDDSFKIVVSDTQAYKQFGNSLVQQKLAHIVEYVLNSM